MDFKHIVSDPPEPEKVDGAIEDRLSGFEEISDSPQRKRLRMPGVAFWDTCLYLLAGALIVAGTHLIGGPGLALLVAGLYLALPTKEK